VPEEMPTHSEPGLDNVGRGLGQGPCWRQEGSSLPSAEVRCLHSREGAGGDSGGNKAPRRDHSTAQPSPEAGFAAGSAPELAGALSNRAWRALVSYCRKQQGGNSFSVGFENFLSNPVPPLHCFSR